MEPSRYFKRNGFYVLKLVFAFVQILFDMSRKYPYNKVNLVVKGSNMEAKTHMLSGAAIVSVGYKLITGAPILDIKEPSFTGICLLGATIVGSIIPDLDIPESAASNKMISLGILIYKRIMELLLSIAFGYLCFILSSGFSFNVIYIIGIMALIYYGMSRRLMRYVKRTIQFIIILILVYFFILTRQMPYILIAAILTLYIMSKHRGFSHTTIINLMATGVVYYTLCYYDYSEIALSASICFLIGTLTHLYLNDLLTNRGVPNPLYPLDVAFRFIFGKGSDLSIKRIKLPITFSTGGPIEIVVSVIAIVGLSFGLDMLNQVQLL